MYSKICHVTKFEQWLETGQKKYMLIKIYNAIEWFHWLAMWMFCCKLYVGFKNSKKTAIMMITLYRNNFSKMDYKKSTNCYNKVEGWKQETFKRLRYTCFPREFNKTFEGTFFTGHLQATASVHKTCKQRLNNYFCYLVLRQCLPQVRS